MPGRGQKELFEKLIREVKVRECLYNIRHPGYKDRHNTEMQWGYVAQAAGMSVMEVKRLWGTLRSSYTRSVKNSITTSGTPAQKKTPWYLEEEMTFLRPHLQLCLGNTTLVPKQETHYPPSPNSLHSPYGNTTLVPKHETHYPPSPNSLHSPYGHDQQREIRFGNIKVEDMSGDVINRRGELEEGEILPEDLVAGAYMMTPQFPERRFNNDCAPPFIDSNSYVSQPQFPVFPEKRPRLDCGSELGESGLYASGPQLPERRVMIDNCGSEFVEQGPYVTTSSPSPMPTSTYTPTPTSSTHTPQFSERKPKLEWGPDTSDYVVRESARKDDSELDFFMGLMPRYKELNKKNKRKFEMQAIHMLYTILDEQDEERS